MTGKILTGKELTIETIKLAITNALSELEEAYIYIKQLEKQEIKKEGK